MRLTAKSIAFSFFAVCAPVALAQTPLFVQPGQVFVAGGPWLGEMTVSGSASTTHVAVTSITTVLWDPSRPDSFLVGSGTSSATGGQLARMTFTAPGQVNSTQIAPAGTFARPLSLSFQQSGTSVVALTSYGQLHAIDVNSGAVTAITSGTQPWGFDASCCAVHASTGDIWVGTTGGDLYRVGSGNGSAQLIQTGLAGTLTGMLIDAPNDRLIFVGTQTMGRIDLPTLSAPQYYFGVFGKPSYSGTLNSASFDQNGDIVLSDYYQVLRMPNVATIPPSGMLPTPIGTFTFPTSAGYSRHCTVVGSTTRPFRMIAEAVAPLGAYLEVQNLPQGTAFGWTLISLSTLLPVNAGPLFGLLPDGLTFSILGFAPSPGNLFAFTGTTPVPVVVPPLGMAPFAGLTFDFVAIAFGPGGQYLGRTNVDRVTWN